MGRGRRCHLDTRAKTRGGGYTGRARLVVAAHRARVAGRGERVEPARGVVDACRAELEQTRTSSGAPMTRERVSRSGRAVSDGESNDTH